MIFPNESIHIQLIYTLTGTSGSSMECGTHGYDFRGAATSKLPKFSAKDTKISLCQRKTVHLTSLFMNLILFRIRVWAADHARSNATTQEPINTGRAVPRKPNGRWISMRQ